MDVGIDRSTMGWCAPRGAGFVPLLLGLLTGAALLSPSSVEAQETPDSVAEAAQDTTPRYALDPLVVTATRTPRPISLAPVPMAVITPQKLSDYVPNTVTDLFRDMPGLDVSGVGANQVRPTIRGQRGQRVLLLADGLRLNNTRRQQDFGELPALVDVSALDRVEVVRGPASVLYGTDAIGGVVNLITRPSVADELHGSFRYRYGSEADQHKGSARVHGSVGKWDINAGATYRDAGWYQAPAGSFGDITLDGPTQVQNTGVKDSSFDLRLGYSIAPTHRVFAAVERYDADDAGFGFVDPAAYAPDEASVRITYPFQKFTKVMAGYSGSDLGSVLADRLDVQIYGQKNERRLDFDLATSFGIPGNPEAGIYVTTEGYTDIGSTGFRIEAKKLAASPLLLTYGLDFFRDDSENQDVSVSTIRGFGPPQVEADSVPNLPFATYRALGAFAQGELSLGSRATLIGGVRFQDMKAQSQETPGLNNTPATDVNRTFVGALNGIYQIADGFSAVGTVGRGFRAPNLIELFFEGPTPEGGGYQERSGDLKPEQSLNVDLGLRYRNRWVAAEGFIFRNTIKDGIRVTPTGEEIDGLDVYRNENVDELLYKGYELSADVYLPANFTVSASYTDLSENNVLDPAYPIGESYSSKVTGRARWADPGDRGWIEYGVRHNGVQKDAALIENPIGTVFPEFTVHDVRAGVTLWRTASGQPQRVVFALRNLTDQLYAEFANASFFRPEAGRSFTMTLELAF